MFYHHPRPIDAVYLEMGPRPGFILKLLSDFNVHPELRNLELYTLNLNL